jgi:hypothetical protein
MGQRVSGPVLVGRDAEVARLQAAIERAAAGQPATVLVAGEAGIGKTRLVTEALGHATDLGAVALAGGCLDVGDGVLAYAPVVEALRPLARLLGPAELERVLDGAGQELARLVPELGLRNAAEQGGPLAPSQLFELLLGCCTASPSAPRCCWWSRICTGPTSPPATCSGSWSATSARAWRWS